MRVIRWCRRRGRGSWILIAASTLGVCPPDDRKCRVKGAEQGVKEPSRSSTFRRTGIGMTSRMTGSKYSLTTAGRRPGTRPPVLHRDASRRPWRSGLPAPYVLPAGFAALLAVGTVAAALGGRLGAAGVLVACAAVVAVLTALAEPMAALPLGVIGWLTAVGFSRPPYADLRLTGAVAGRAAVTLALVACCAAVAGTAFRWRATGVNIESVDQHEQSGLS